MKTYVIKRANDVWLLKPDERYVREIMRFRTRARAIETADTLFANEEAIVRVHRANGTPELERVYPLTTSP